MKEYPILFTGEMVCAILAGSKTQTRRVIKPQPTLTESRHHPGVQIMRWRSKVDTPLKIGPDVMRRFCPYGGPGDRLWLRETWGVDAPLDEVRAAREDVMRSSFGASVYYRADATHEGSGLTWRPSIHMPRWASRITLEVTDVRVERVQAISEGDAIAEGIRPHSELPNWPRVAFSALWDGINGKRGYGWDANPWVWVVSFTRLT